jgi:hypothetical protein
MSISSMRSKKTSRYKNLHDSESLYSENKIFEEITFFFQSKADTYLLPYFDKQDLFKLSQGKYIYPFYYIEF